MRPVHALPANWNHIEEIQEPPSCKASQGFLWHPTAEFDHHLMDIELQKKKNFKEKKLMKTKRNMKFKISIIK